MLQKYIVENDSNIGNVVFELEYNLNNLGATLGNSTVVTKTEATQGTTQKHQYTTVVTISGSGKTISSGFSCRLARLGNNASDTYANTIFITRVALHYEADTTGSRTMMTK